MVTRQLKQCDYERTLQYLEKYAVQNPLSASCEIIMTIDNTKYQLRFQPEGSNKLLILQAIKTSLDNPQEQNLITNNLVLMAFLEVFLFRLSH